jgi:predicted lipid-binding transport protein (Tim44 family)
MRGLAGGLAGGLIGGMIGNMLFGGSGHAAGAAAGGSGCSSIGLFDILLIVGLVYLGYRLLNRRREDSDRYVGPDSTQASNLPGSWQEPPPVTTVEQFPPSVDLGAIQNYDRDFNEAAFKEKAQDIFFKLQGAWTRQELSTIRDLVADDLYNSLSRDLEAMMAKGQINRLENIAIRQVEISEAWQEEGKDYITVGFLANLLDYVVDSKTSQVVGGSDKEPVKFEEYWTFVRPLGPGPWKLTAIQQP